MHPSPTEERDRSRSGQDSLNTSALAEDNADLRSFLEQFDTVIQAYNKFLADADVRKKNAVPPLPTPPPLPPPPPPPPQPNQNSSLDLLLQHLQQQQQQHQHQQHVAPPAASPVTPAADTSLGSVSEELQRAAAAVLMQQQQMQQQQQFDLGVLRTLMQEAAQQEAERRRMEAEKVHLRAEIERMGLLGPLNPPSAAPVHTPRRRSTPGTTPRNHHLSASTISVVSSYGDRHHRSRSATKLLRSPRSTRGNSTTTVAGGRRSRSAKEQIKESNAVDTSLTSGFFLPEDLKGCASFPREPRFLTPTGFKDPTVPFYFLADAVENDIKTTRSGKRTTSLNRGSTSTRGSLHTNVTSKWGSLSSSGGGMSPGPGSYFPRWSKLSNV